LQTNKKHKNQQLCFPSHSFLQRLLLLMGWSL
jgi:hypothetical protein